MKRMLFLLAEFFTFLNVVLRGKLIICNFAVADRIAEARSWAMREGRQT